MPPLEGQLGSRLLEAGLMTADEWAQWLASLTAEQRSVDDRGLSELLVRSGRVTRFQLQQVAAGKAASLTLGNYVLVDKIGQGGMGMVFKAQHRRMKRVVALKILPPAMVKDASSVHRFQREVQAAARLLHPNIVAAYDADEAHGAHFLVMEYVDGSDLSTLVKAHGPLACHTAVDYVLQAARGLAFAHAHGVIHRDIKPANLLVDRKGVVKVLDMGLARIDDESADHARSELTTTGTVMGTIDYMSPEQALNTKHATHHSDQYSLGVTLFYLLTGRPPFAGETAMEKLLAHRDAPIPSLATVCPGTPATLDAAFRRMLAKRPADRFASLSDCVTEFERFLAETGAAITQAPPPLVDPQLQSFLSALGHPGPATLAETRLDASDDAALAATIVTSGFSDTDLTASTRTTAVGHPLSGIHRSQRRPWWGRPAVWLSALVVLFVASATFLVRRGTREESGEALPRAAALPETSPGAPPPAAHPAETPAQVLAWVLENHGQAWCGPRGAITEVTSLEQWQNLGGGPITVLRLGRHTRLSDDDVARLQVFKDLHTLNLYECASLGDRGVARFGAFRQLVDLNLAGTGITDDGLQYLDHLQDLQSLTLSDTGIRGPGLRRLMRLGRISHLDLNYLKIDDASLSALTALPELSTLYLNGCTLLTDACAKTLAKLSVVTLSLDATLLGDATLDALVEAQGLRSLAVNSTRVTGAGLVKFAARRPIDAVGCQGIKFSPAEAEALREAWPDASIAASVEIPPVRSEILARIKPAEHTVAGAWRKLAGPSLYSFHSPAAPVDLLRLPVREIPPSYMLILNVDRSADSGAGALGLVLAVGGGQVLLKIDDGPRGGCYFSSIQRRRGPVNDFPVEPELTRLVIGQQRQIQVHVRPRPGGMYELRAQLDGNLVGSVDVDPEDLSLPADVQLRGWNGLALAAWDSFGVHYATIHPLPPIEWGEGNVPIVDFTYPQSAPQDLSALEALTSPDWTWTPPRNLGPRINNAAMQNLPRLFRGELGLILQEYGGDRTLLEYWRPSIEAAWRPANPIPRAPDGELYHPYVTGDGCLLLASLQTSTADGAAHTLMQSTRPDPDAGWSPWTPLFTGDGPQSGNSEQFPVLSADGLELLFASSRDGGLGSYDIWISRRKTTNDPWPAAVHSGSVLNSPGMDAPCCLIADGLGLILHTDRAGGRGGADLWIATRPSRDGEWSDPIHLGAEINSEFHDYSATLLSDGRTLLFDSNVLSGYGGYDLWATRRVRKESPD